MEGSRRSRKRLIVATALLGTFVALCPAPGQQTQPPMLYEILQKLEANLDRYDRSVPSLFCDEHVVSQVSPSQGHQDTVTDSVFRLKRVVNRDHTSTLDESREVKTVNGKPATSQDIAGPTILSGAFEGGLAVVSLGQRSCMNYTLERTKRNDPTTPYIVRFSSALTLQNSAGCLLQENGKGRAFIDPATMQITRMELTTPHHIITPGSFYDRPTVGDRVLSVDYAPVPLEGQTFWMPATIASTVTSGRGTFHAIVWSFKASYRNFHKLEVTSRIVPAGDAPAP
jgi:hypothetical protein